MMFPGINRRAVGAFEMAWSKGFGKRATGDKFSVEENRGVEEGFCFVDRMVRNKKQFAPLLECLEGLRKGIAAGAIKSGKGLVEEVNVRFLCPGAGQKGSLLLPPLERLDLAIGQGSQPEEFQSIAHCGAISWREFPQKSHVLIATHLHESFDSDGKIPINGFPLREVGNP